MRSVVGMATLLELELSPRGLALLEVDTAIVRLGGIIFFTLCGKEQRAEDRETPNFLCIKFAICGVSNFDLMRRFFGLT